MIGNVMRLGNLLPFGQDIESGEFVDVGSVPNGDKCGCICPSCKTFLTARQGEKNEWHFAHKVNKSHNSTKVPCDFSFYVSVRMMIRQISETGLDLKIPLLNVPSQNYDETKKILLPVNLPVVSREHIHLQNVRVGEKFSGVLVDVVASVQCVPFVIFVSYKDRLVPIELFDPKESKAGVIEFDAKALREAFQKTKNGQYLEALKSFLMNEVEGKRWIYHPRYKEVEQKAFIQSEDAKKQKNLP
ncbi:competence protein CoiA family protein [Marinomonas sp. TW1]|uniref:competence protein CoiA family protein n=1 Tax=Marinomonas sp. TW1 TaxID=1561203 RepID=UPI0012E79A19|nr:hypothetical protein [Marinomonas sp. TW1]